MRDPEKISARRRALLGDRAGSFAETKYLRMSATKVRRVIDLVRGQDVNSALAILRFAPQAAAQPAYKTLASAVANAEQQEGLEADDLFISAIFADEGVTLRRIRPRAKGSASRILKRGAHLTVVVEPHEAPEPEPKKATPKAAAKPAKTDAKPPKKAETEDVVEDKDDKTAVEPVETPSKAKPAAKKAAPKKTAAGTNETSSSDEAEAPKAKPTRAKAAKATKADDSDESKEA